MVQVLIYRVNNTSSATFVQGRNAVYADLALLAIPAANWLSTEVTHNEEKDYIDIVITYESELL